MSNSNGPQNPPHYGANGQQHSEQQNPAQPSPGQQYPPYAPNYGMPNPAPGYAPQNQPYVQPGGYYSPLPSRPWNVLCIVGFVLAFLLPPVGLVLCIIALIQINRSFEQSKGLSIAGIIIGALGTAIIVLVIGAVAWVFNNMSFYEDQMCYQGNCTDYSDTDNGITARAASIAVWPLVSDTQK